MRGLTLRISLILTGTMMLVGLAWFGAFRYQQSLDPFLTLRMPLPEQAAAIVELIEATPLDRLPLTLKALNSPTLRVAVTDRMPDAEPKSIPLPGLSWAVRGYLDTLGDRSVQAAVASGNEQSDKTSSAPSESRRLIRLVIGLRDARFVTIEARGGILGYLLSLRLATMAMFTLTLIGGASLWLLRRQIRPLEQVIDAIEHFGESLDAPALEEHGALEVRRLVAAFNLMQTRIHALIEGRTRMLAAISHDFGTYLTRLRLRVEYIGDQEQLNRAVRDIEDMQSLMSDTLELGKLERDTVSNEDVDLAALTRQRVQTLAATGADVRLVATETARMRGRPSALNRVVDNLIANAVKYAGAAEVTVQQRSAVDDRTIELLVEDRGPGIPPEARELVLEPFYRRDSARNLDVAGFGLGLAIVAEIVRRHLGTLSLEDRPGGGLTVRVRFAAI